MPRLVTVSDVRQALYWAAGGPASAGEGAPTLPLLGQLFHQTYGGLTGTDPLLNLVRPLEQADATVDAWKRQLVRHTYAWHVAPALAEHHAALQPNAREVLDFWAAVRALAEWLADVMWAQAPAQGALERVRALVFADQERELSVELSDPTWDDTVVVSGRLDALLRQPATGEVCLVELKTGRTAPEADLCQAALYHRLLANDGQAPTQVAVLAFEPARREHVFAGPRLAEAEAALLALVGRLAAAQSPRPVPSTASVAPVPPVAPVLPSAVAAARRRLAEGLLAGFAEFGIGVKLEPEPLVGPTFIRFFAHPDRGVRVREIEALPRDLWARLAVDRPPQISIQRGRIAIDVQRPDPQTVLWSRDVRPHLLPPSSEGVSRFPVGVAVDGSLHWADLAEPDACHLLVAGTTGSGKSEWMRALIASLLASNGRGTLRLVLIDPKRVAFKPFEGADCLWRPVVFPDETDVAGVFDDLIAEMDRRYQAGISDLRAHNRSAAVPVPRLVCVCDELADLMESADRKHRRELERRVGRLGAKARGCGIHLVFATQRPSADLIKGSIRANLVARVALRVDSALNSRLIIERAGAEALLGRGDLLFRSVGDPVRVQSPYVTEAELRTLVGR